MGKRKLSDRQKLFWAAVALGSGLTIFFFGVSEVPFGFSVAELGDILRGWFTIICGIGILIMGFKLAPYRDENPAESTNEGTHQPGEEKGALIDNPTSDDIEYYNRLSTERQALLNALLDQSRSLDKYILTLAGGALGLSLVFIKDIAPTPKAETIGVLVGSWVSFCISILITLLSFLLSQKAIFKQIGITEGLISGKLDQNRKHPNPFRTATGILNWISMVSFIVGVILLITFAAINLSFPT